MTDVEKYIGESAMKDRPEKKLNLRIKEGAIVTDLLGKGAVTNSKIADGAVTTDKLSGVDDPGGAAVTTSKIVDNAVTESKIAKDAVTSDKIQEDAINSDHIKESAVESRNIGDGQVLSRHIQDNAVTSDKLSGADSEAGAAVTAGKIAAGAIHTEHIAANAVVAGNIASGAVQEGNIAAGAVTAGKIAANAVVEGNIAEGAVTTAKIKDGSVTTNDIATGAVTEEKLAPGAITTDKLDTPVITQLQTIMDEVPTAGSVKPINSGGVLAHGSAFDVSEYNKSEGVLATYETLAAALDAVPATSRRGGMSIKFILRTNTGTEEEPVYNDEYVQHRYMCTSIATADFTNTANWQGVTGEIKAGSRDLVESGVVFRTTPTINKDDSTADLNIGDEGGNVIVQFKDGHIKTKNFDSSTIKTDVEVKSDTSSASLNIGDEDGNVIAQFKNGHIKTKNFDSSATSKTIEIPFNIEDFTTYVNDVVQIFKYPVTFIPNYRDYSVNIFMDTEDNNIRKQCRCLERFAEVTPLATGTYPMGVKVFTHDGYLLGEKSFNMTVINRPSNPSSVINVLCIGDSITQGITNLSGISVSEGASESAGHPWVIEVKSYLGNREGNNTTPAGLNLPNIHLIGTNNTNNARHEGHGGWSVSSFLGTSSPFYINGQIDFNAYLAQDEVYDDTSNKGVDFIYILLGANGGTEKSIVNGKIFIDPSEYSRTIKNFIDKIKEQIIEGNGTYANPNCKVILLSYPSQWTSGYGYHPSGSGQWTDGTVTARGMMACYYENVKIAAMDDYKSFCSTYMVAPFVDSENSFAYINKQINKRVSETYKALIEQVHPNSLGYTMMGEAIVRDIISRIN